MKTQHSGEMRYTICWDSPYRYTGTSKIEYLIASLDNARRNAKLALRSAEILPLVTGNSRSSADGEFLSFQTESCSFYLESTPGKPWTMYAVDLLDVEPNMKSRLVLLQWYYPHGRTHAMTINAGEIFSKRT